MIVDILKAILKNIQVFLVVWAVVIIANQIFIFGACFAPYCLLAALPHTGIIASLLTFSWAKIESDSLQETEHKEFRQRQSKLKLDERINQFKKSLADDAQPKKHNNNDKLLKNIASSEKNNQSNLFTQNEDERFKRPETIASKADRDFISQKVYITRANEARILKESNYKHSDQNFHDLYDQSFEFILSTPELALLKLYKSICEDPSKLLDAYTKIRTHDTKKYVWEGSKPAYHFDKLCPRLNAEFTNLLIPEEIKHRGEQSIVNFRAFTKKNRDILENDEEKFLRMLEARFALKNPPKSLKYDNSGFKLLENYSLEQLKEKIDELLHVAKDFKEKDKATYELITKLGYGTHIVKEAKIQGNPLYTWHQYKVELKNLLAQYFRVRFNHELEFEESLLEQIGFKPCDYCKSKTN